MTNFLNTRILLSGATILAAAVVIVGATLAFFSDVETSEANAFTAGDVQIAIGNLDHDYTGTGELGGEPTFDWDEDGFSFELTDIKPLDSGLVSYTLTNDANDAIVCAMVEEDNNTENARNDSEIEAGDTTGGDPGLGNGELQNFMSFSFGGESGPLSEIDGEWFNVGPIAGDGGEGSFGIGYCFGDYVGEDCVASSQEGVNMAQTDGMTADISFQAVQARNNPGFTCDSLNEEPSENLVGAALGDFTPIPLDSAECTATVGVGSGDNDFATIQAAIDDAGTANGDTVCVAEGVYDEDVTIDKEITLSGDGTSATSVINGQTPGVGGTVVIAADNVTVEGFEINGAGGNSQDSAIYISGARSGATIQYNALNAGSGGLALLAEGGQSNHTVKSNVLNGDDSPQISYVNGSASVNVASTNVDFLNNTFGGTVVVGGLPFGFEASSSDVMKNVFDVTSTFSVVETWATGIALNMNNFNGAGGIKVTHSENSNTGDTGTLDATNNWWGDADASDNVAGDVNFEPEAPAAFTPNP